MADIAYSRTFQHADWIDGEDTVSAAGEKGFNQKFHDLEGEFDKVATVFGIVNSVLSSIQQLADGSVTTSKIADNAVTNPKIGPGAVSLEKLANNSVGINQIQNGAISTAKLQANAVARANIQNGAVNLDKIAFQQVNSGSANLPANGGTATQLVQQNVPNTKAIVYFPMLTLTSSSGAGQSEVEPAIVYRQTVGSSTVDVFIRLVNKGSAAAGVIWVVSTFAS